MVRLEDIVLDRKIERGSVQTNTLRRERVFERNGHEKAQKTQKDETRDCRSDPRNGDGIDHGLHGLHGLRELGRWKHENQGHRMGDEHAGCKFLKIRVIRVIRGFYSRI